MAGKQFDRSYDPTFDSRAAELSQAATVQQEAADAADGATTNVATPVGGHGSAGGDPGAIEQIGNDLSEAAEDALLAAAAAAAAAAPPVAAAAAVIDQAGEAVDLAEDAGEAVGDALDDLFGGGHETGGSTFAVDPNAAPPTEDPGDVMTRAEASWKAQARVTEAKYGEVGNAGPERHGDFGDFRQQDIADHDTHAQADTTLHLDPGLAGPGATGGNAVTAPDGAMEPVAGLSPEVAIGADVTAGVPLGAPDDVFEPVTVSDSHVTLAADVPVDPGMAGPAAAGGNAVTAPDGTMEPVTGLNSDVAVGADPVIDVDQLLSPEHAPAPVAFGADVELNPQPIPPGIDLHPPSPIAPTLGAEVELNPQPIPPGIGADIGEPAAAAVYQESVDNSSIIIVGGAEAPLIADDDTLGFDSGHVGIADSQLEQDIASTLAADSDGPDLGRIGIEEESIDVGITEDEFDG